MPFPHYSFVQVPRKSKECGYSDQLCISWPFGVNDLRWPLDDLWVEVTCVPLTEYYVVQVPWNPKYVDTVTNCAYLDHWGQWPQMTPRWDLWVRVTYLPIRQYPFVQVPWKSIKGRQWPWTTFELGLHVFPYPNILLSKSYENPPKYVDACSDYLWSMTSDNP